jgi:hypothetical protein
MTPVFNPFLFNNACLAMLEYVARTNVRLMRISLQTLTDINPLLRLPHASPMVNRKPIISGSIVAVADATPAPVAPDVTLAAAVVPPAVARGGAAAAITVGMPAPKPSARRRAHREPSLPPELPPVLPPRSPKKPRAN